MMGEHLNIDANTHPFIMHSNDWDMDSNGRISQLETHGMDCQQIRFTMMTQSPFKPPTGIFLNLTLRENFHLAMCHRRLNLTQQKAFVSVLQPQHRQPLEPLSLIRILWDIH